MSKAERIALLVADGWQCFENSEWFYKDELVNYQGVLPAVDRRITRIESEVEG